MRMPVNLMMAIGKAAMHQAGFGLIGDAVEIAKAAWEDWKKSPEERIDELEALIQADDAEVVCAAEHVAAKLAANQPEPVRMKLATYLEQIPSRVRQSQRRPADPTGRTIRPGFVVNRPKDLIPFIPHQVPRFQPGDRPLGGVDWELVELLGMGGFGEVWKARNAHFDSLAPVALKFCTDHLARERLLRHEAKVLDRVMQHGRHPGIVPLEMTYLSADPPCLQYEYIEGGDLGGLILDWNRQAEKPSAEQVAWELLRIAEIVAFAHRIEPAIVHRDLKPENILVQRSSDGEIVFKITDFGIGGIATMQAIQATHQPASPREFLTTAVRGSGTFLYSSPEQLQGNDPDPRDDVHALGVIWYQMMTGNLTSKPSGGAAWRRRFFDRGMSAAILEILEACFEDQEGRPDDAAVLAEKLGALLKPKIDKVEAGTVNGKVLEEHHLAPPAHPAHPERHAEIIQAAIERDPKPETIDADHGPKPRVVLEPQPDSLPSSIDPVRQPKSKTQHADALKSEVQAMLGGVIQSEPLLVDTPAGSRSQGPALSGQLLGMPPKRRGIPLLRLCLIVLPLLAVLGITIHIVTDTGTVIITGTDPNMIAWIDGREIRIENLGEPITLRTGEHNLLVKRGDLVVKTQTFQIQRGQETPLARVYHVVFEKTFPATT